MHRSLYAAVLGVGLMASAAQAAGPVWASGVVDYAAGLGITAQLDPNAALNAPAPWMGVSIGWPALLNPFSPQFDADQIVGIGQGGSLTLELAKPVSVTGTPQIGVITSSGLFDTTFFGDTGNPPHTFASFEYGAQRSAKVEVADVVGNFKSLGQIVFENPANFYTNLSGPYAFMAPVPPTLADFAKPFTGTLADFAGKSFDEVLSVLDGSGGGQWLTVPADLGLAEVRFIRFSEPMWLLADGSHGVDAVSIYDGSRKPADFFIDAIVAVPEPGSAAMLLLAGMTMLRRRR